MRENSQKCLREDRTKYQWRRVKSITSVRVANLRTNPSVTGPTKTLLSSLCFSPGTKRMEMLISVDVKDLRTYLYVTVLTIIPSIGDQQLKTIWNYS